MDNPLEKMLERIVGAVDRAGEKWHDAMRAGLAQTEKAVRLRGARNRPLYGSGLVWNGTGRFAGASLVNAGGTDVTVTWTEGPDGTGDFVAGAIVKAGTSTQITPPSPGISFNRLTVTVSGGSVQGSSYLGAVD